jgi:hypothetical protein
MLFILFCWESPRWLYARGRKEEARRVLAEFHTRDGDLHSPIVEIEIAEFKENISLEGGDKRFWDFKCLFKDFGSRYRFGLCVLVSIWGQLSGNGLVTCGSLFSLSPSLAPTSSLLFTLTRSELFPCNE